jgi:predicted ATPase
LFSVRYGFWAANYVTFNGDVLRDLAAQFLALAKKQAAAAPLMIGYRLAGTALMLTGEFAEALVHLNQAIALYDPAEHRPLATQFGHDVEVAALGDRSWTQWLLGYPEAARTDAERALKNAREIGQAATLMWTLSHVAILHTLYGDRDAAAARAQELVALAEEKGSTYWKAIGMASRGCLLALTGRASDAIDMLASAITALRAMGFIFWMPLYLPHLARAHGQLGQLDEAWRCIGEAITAVEITKERWCEAEVHRVAGEVALRSPEPDAVKAQRHFEAALAVAREQQAKSWELRAAISMARLWRDQGKRGEARELLAPVYGCFTEGFDRPDLKEAKTLLDEQAS